MFVLPLQKIWPKPGPEAQRPAPETKKEFPGHPWVGRPWARRGKKKYKEDSSGSAPMH